MVFGPATGLVDLASDAADVTIEGPGTVTIDIDENTSVLSAHEEIRGAIDLHLSEGGVIKEHRDMLGGILDLRELEVGEVMIHRKSMITIEADLPNDDIMAQVLDSPYTRIPLWRGEPENIVGILHAKDLLKAIKSLHVHAQLCE